MQKALYIIPLFALAILSVTPTPAAALSCLPTDMYISSIIGNEDTVIFAAKTDSTIQAKDYTAEALTVVSAYQGYVEGKLIAYHAKHPDWGYLCNSGPMGDKTEGVYIATRNQATGKYQVTQRLETTSDLMGEIKEQLKAKEITGEVVEFNKTDRINQIKTTITDLFGEIITLLKEQMYWQGLK